jgi:uncharacterized membrane protein
MRREGIAARAAGLVAAGLMLTLAACGRGQDGTTQSGTGLGEAQRPEITEEELRAKSAALLAKLGAPADAATKARYAGDFEAVGAEPDWRLTLLKDGYVSFTRPGLEQIDAIPGARDLRQLGAYVEAGPLSIAVAAGPCTYGEGGESYPFSATVLYEGIAYEGCARAGAATTAEPTGARARGWAVDLSQLLPAIDACIARASARPARVTIAYVNEEGQAAVRLLEADGGRSECLSSLDGAAIASFEPLADRDVFRGERDPMFTRAPANAPAGSCTTSEEVKGSGGATLGWLSRKSC